MKYIDIFYEIANKTLPVYRSYREDINNLNIEIKKDNTLLTKADIEIQNIIVDTILKYDANVNIIAEEINLRHFITTNKYTWIIDPIDGTKPFTISSNYDYCCAICLLEGGIPIAGMIYAPELGRNRTPILAIASVITEEIFINGLLYNVSNSKHMKYASTTRSSGTVASKIEKYLKGKNIDVKNETTSQSLDMLRTAVDISLYSDFDSRHFSVFYREKQKLWDGAPGICFNRIAGKKIVDSLGNETIPFTNSFLKQKEPILNTIIIAYPDDLDELLAL